MSTGIYRLSLFALCAMGLFSCIPQKKIIYLQKTAATLSDTLKVEDVDYMIQAKDRLYIRVTSFNKAVTEFFNLQNGTQSGGIAGGSGGRALLNSYYVNASGYVEIPMLDSVKVAGLTIPQAQDTVQVAIRAQVSDAFVNVVLANFKVTVLGEVGGGGIVNSTDNRMTIFDAITAAGGASQYADLRHIRIVRKDKGEVNISIVDLTARDIIQSEFYYMHPNDIVYVQPLKAKAFLTNLRTISGVIGIVVGFILLERLIPGNGK